MNKQLTQQEYVHEGGECCPACHQDRVEGLEHIAGEGSQAARRVQCNECGAEWVEVYKLIGYESLQIE